MEQYVLQAFGPSFDAVWGVDLMFSIPKIEHYHKR